MSTKGTKLTREEFKQKQEIEAARKAGTVPAEVDFVTGKEINPHIPQYILQAPWYLDKGVPTLQHQRPQKEAEVEKKDDWYVKGAQGTTATKYRKGACENCGAISHKAKDCVERPRKMGAKVTGKDIRPDEIVKDLEFSYDSKRDRYNGYDPAYYMEHIEEWEKIDEQRKELKKQELDQDLKEDISLKDEDKYADDADMAGQKVDLKTRTTVRNLRIREDTAKYLRNLDTNSAFYDPKTRSMRDNPTQSKDPTELDYAGDNFLRYTGDAPKMSEAQLFCWDADKQGVNVILQANPTQVELLNKGFREKKEKLNETIKNDILEKYGGAEHFNAPPKELLIAQSERYVEYSRTGQILKGDELRLAKSRYEEDVYPMNHTSVWGSYWEDGQWGFSCCHQFIKNSFCTGKAGIEAKKQSEAIAQANNPHQAQEKEDSNGKEEEEESSNEEQSKKRKHSSTES